MTAHVSKQSILLLALTMLLCACGRPDDNTGMTGVQKTAQHAPETPVQAINKTTHPSATVPVLNLDPLLTPEDAAQLAGLPAEKAKRNRLSNPINSLHYAWSSDRKRQLPTGLKLPLDNEIQIFQPAVRVRTSEVDFRRQHLQAPDPAAVERALQGLRDTKRYQAMTKAQQKMAEQMLLGAANRTPMTAVEYVGQVAAWDERTSTLYVLHDEFVFATMVNVSDESGRNRDLAVKLANLAISRL